MTTRISVRRTEAAQPTTRGGLMAALVGPNGTAPGAETAIEFETDDIEIGDVEKSAGWIEDLAAVASSALRHAATGEIVTTLQEDFVAAEVVDDDEGLTETEQEADKNAAEARAEAVREVVQSVLDTAIGDPTQITTHRIVSALVSKGLVR